MGYSTVLTGQHEVVDAGVGRELFYTAVLAQILGRLGLSPALNSLPDDDAALCSEIIFVYERQLYYEAGYWRCDTLKQAIEEQMHLYRSAFEVDASGVTRRKPRETKVNWLCLGRQSFIYHVHHGSPLFRLSLATLPLAPLRGTRC